MEHNRKQKLLMIIALVVGIASLSVGFAAFSATLNISSQASVSPSSDTFSVAFSLIETETRTGQMDVYSKSPNVTSEMVSVSNEPTPLVSNINVGFSQPGQYVLYRLYIRNEGEYTAYLNNVNFIGNKVCTSESNATESLVQSACDDIKITVQIAETVYDDTTKINNHILEAGTSEDFFVKLEYAADGAYSDGPFSVSFPNISIVYSTIDDSSIQPVIPSDKVVQLVSGNLNDPGSIVSIGDEQFYVFGQEDGNVKLLSMYNLYVGNQYDDDNGAVPLTSPTGKQSEMARGWFDGYNSTNPIIGVTAFSNTNSIYEGSIVEGYVNNYKTILESDYGLDVIEARLISYDELTDSETFECIELDKCSDKYPWIYSTSYWSGSTYDADSIGYVYSSGRFGHDGYGSGHYFGVRPVIEISVSEF